MKPLQLRLHHFASFRGEHLLDLEHLSLFAIQGRTGSGKSSLLDALCFALYGKTPRLSTKTAHLISMGEKQLKVELIFESEGQKYQIFRSKGSRSEVRFNIWQQERWRPQSSETQTRAVDKSIEQVVGLPFEQFIRAVLLPQGQFDRFLHGSPADRKSMLGSLIGIETYEKMYEKAKERAQHADSRYQSLYQLLKQEYGHIHEAAREELQEQLAQTETAQQNAETAHTQRLSQLEDWHQRHQYHQQRVTVQSTLSQLEQNRDSIEHKKQRIQLARQVASILPMVQQQQQLQREAEQANQQQLQAIQRAQTSQKAWQQLQPELEHARLQAEQIPQWRHNLEEAQQLLPDWQQWGQVPYPASSQTTRWDRVRYQQLAELQQQEQAVANGEHSLAQLEQQLTQAQQQLAELEQSWQNSLQQSLAAEQQHLATQEQLTQLQDLEKRAKFWQNQRQSLPTPWPSPLTWDRDAYQTAQQDANSWQQYQAKQDQLQASIQTDQQLLASYSSEQHTLNQQIAQEQQHLHTLQSQIDELERLAPALALRPQLQLDQACPVCLQTVHHLPAATTGADLAQLRKTLRSQQKSLQDTQQKHYQLGLQQQNINEKLHSNQQELQHVRQHFAQLQAQYPNSSPLSYQQQMVVGLGEQVEAVLQGRDYALAYQQQQQLSQQHRQLFHVLQQQQLKQRQTLDTVQGRRDADQERLELQRQHWQSLHTKLHHSQHSLASHSPASTAEQLANLLAGLHAQVQQLSALPLPRFITEQKQRLQHTEQQLQQLNQRHQQLDTELQLAQQAAQHAKQLHSRLSTQLGALQQQVAAQLAPLGMELSDVYANHLPEMQIVELEQQVQHWQQQHLQLHMQLESILALLVERPYQAEPYQALLAECAQAEQELQQLQAQCYQQHYALEQLTQTLQLKYQRQDECRELEMQMLHWKELRQSLAPAKFQRYLLEDLEHQLLHQASALLFEISEGRYQLTLHDGDYAVADSWNGGEVRDIKTLSGGETFLASLSLAISLSDHLAGHRHLGALFLDEGFGTLDPDSLESVAKALEQLQISGRTIGLITHVESLARRLPHRILVHKTEQGSTLDAGLINT